MKIRWIFNALAAMEAVLCPALCLMYAFCGLALWTQTVYFCPLLGAVLAALWSFGRTSRRALPEVITSSMITTFSPSSRVLPTNIPPSP